jgi:hypothetical protein
LNSVDTDLLKDHVVANMFLIPNAIFHGSPDITVGLYIWKGILPALIGNILGGGLFVGVLYWYLHLQGQEPVAIDGVYYKSHETKSSGIDLQSLIRNHNEKVSMRGDEHV